MSDKEESLTSDLLEFHEGDELVIDEEGKVSTTEKPAEGDKPGEEAVEEEGVEPDKEVDKPPVEKEPEPKFKSQDEAESAYAEAQKTITQLTQRMSVLEKAFLEKPDTPIEPGPDPVKLVVTKHNTEARKKISELDREADDYDTQVMDIWSETQANISREVTDMAVRGSRQADAMESEQLSYATKRMETAGLDGEQIDFIWTYIAPRVPRNAGETLDEQVDWAVKEFLKIPWTKKADQIKKRDLKVLGKEAHSAPKVKDKRGEDIEPDTLSAGIERLSMERTIKK